MEIKNDVEKLEQELVASFKEYQKLGKYHYSHELKKKVFNAFSMDIKQERIVKLCHVSSSTVANWFYLFRRRPADFKKTAQSQFREIKISPHVEEKINSSRPETFSPAQNQNINVVKIKFPNGIRIEYKSPEVNTLVRDLFFIKP